MRTLKSAVNVIAVAGIVLSMAQFSSADGDHAHGQATKLSKHDQLKIAAQKICPVTGEKLGSMGTPLKAKIGEEELFLCCKGCTTGQVSREHWATIHANFAKAQGQCPVMEKALPKNPKWTVVNGQIIYVCCPPCTKKIQADPKTYLTKLDALYATAQKKDRAANQNVKSLR